MAPFNVQWLFNWWRRIAYVCEHWNEMDWKMASECETMRGPYITSCSLAALIRCHWFLIPVGHSKFNEIWIKTLINNSKNVLKFRSIKDGNSIVHTTARCRSSARIIHPNVQFVLMNMHSATNAILLHAHLFLSILFVRVNENATEKRQKQIITNWCFICINICVLSEANY